MFASILSGDFLGNDNLTIPVEELADDPCRADNCYHVFNHKGVGAFESETILDGFTITAGNAAGPEGHDIGGGMLYCPSNLIVAGCTFTNNSASLDGGGMYNVSYALSSYESIINCTFRWNMAERGGGMYIEGNIPTITGCMFTSNLADKGGGMFNIQRLPASSSVTVTYCTFRGNSAKYGGGMYTNTLLSAVMPSLLSIMSNIVFAGNSADIAGGGIYNYKSDIFLVNCSFTGNISNTGGGINNESSDPLMINCTFSGNSADDYGGGMCNSDNSRPELSNSILWGNTAISGGNEIALLTSSVVEVDYSDISGGLAGIYDDGSGNTVHWGADNIDADPLFVDADGGDNTYGTADDDVRLAPGSLGIEGGANSFVPGGIRTDMEGNGRILDSDGDGTFTVDMGAFEYKFFSYGDVVYVNRRATGGLNTGLSWEDAFLSLQDALYAAAGEPSQIWVAEGIYYPSYNYKNSGMVEGGQHFYMLNGVCIYGGFSDTGNPGWDDRDPKTYETILSGHIRRPGDVNCSNVFYHPRGLLLDHTAILYGFTITGGTGYRNEVAGGGMYNQNNSPTIINCIFTGNSAFGFGGGMCNSTNSSPIVTNCTFTKNVVDFIYGSGGGGMGNSNSSPIVTGCIFDDNSTAGSGGGMLNMGGNPTLINCTFSDNQANFCGGIYSTHSCRLSIRNSILWHNTAASGGGAIALMYTSTIDINYCAVQNGQFSIYDDDSGNTINWGLGNIAKNPLFVRASSDSLHLKFYSPCIDGGDPMGDYGGQVDRDGGNRVRYGRVDMGAYEVYPVAGDFEGDEDVDLVDFGVFCNRWLEMGCVGPSWCGGADIDGDGRVDLRDYCWFAGHWLR
ncbi:MAG: hypothetical protein GY869_13500 [Planctomycetes bacterium]|nr:hypothetical protein [Planctomycetota bacterium]